MWDEITLCLNGNLDHNSYKGTGSDIVSAVGRLPSISAVVCLFLLTIPYQRPASYIQGPPMRSRDELAPVLSPESFHGGSITCSFPWVIAFSLTLSWSERTCNTDLERWTLLCSLAGKKITLAQNVGHVKVEVDVWKSIKIEDLNAAERQFAVVSFP